MSARLGTAFVDGEVVDLAGLAVPLLEEGLLRGDGAFETLGVWGGRPFRVAAHLRRLQSSLAALGLTAVEIDAVAAGIARLTDGLPAVDGVLRVYALASGRWIVTLSPQPQRPEIRSLSSQPAPWIRPPGSYAGAGAKSMSYAPNMAALRAAQRAGADDALLVALEGWVLEGTTFAVLWVRDGVLRAPSLDLGVIDSISRAVMLEAAREAGIPVEEGRWPLDDLAAASEVLVSSSVRHCVAVERVDDHCFDGPTPVCDRLAAALAAARRAG